MDVIRQVTQIMCTRAAKCTSRHYFIFEELGSSAVTITQLLLNGQAVCNMAMARYPEAESLLEEVISKQGNHPEALADMISLAVLTGKGWSAAEEHIG